MKISKESLWDEGVNDCDECGGETQDVIRIAFKQYSCVFLLCKPCLDKLVKHLGLLADPTARRLWNE